MAFVRTQQSVRTTAVDPIFLDEVLASSQDKNFKKIDDYFSSAHLARNQVFRRDASFSLCNQAKKELSASEDLRKCGISLSPAAAKAAEMCYADFPEEDDGLFTEESIEESKYGYAIDQLALRLEVRSELANNSKAIDTLEELLDQPEEFVESRRCLARTKRNNAARYNKSRHFHLTRATRRRQQIRMLQTLPCEFPYNLHPYYLPACCTLQRVTEILG